MPSHAQVAAKVRAHKQTWPELYCRVPACLWRVKHDGRPDTPCRKHPVPLPQVEMDLNPPTLSTPHVPRTPYPWCVGNPTREDCARAGYCRRDPSCGD